MQAKGWAATVASSRRRGSNQRPLPRLSPILHDDFKRQCKPLKGGEHKLTGNFGESCNQQKRFQAVMASHINSGHAPRVLPSAICLQVLSSSHSVTHHDITLGRNVRRTSDGQCVI